MTLDSTFPHVISGLKKAILISTAAHQTLVNAPEPIDSWQPTNTVVEKLVYAINQYRVKFIEGLTSLSHPNTDPAIAHYLNDPRSFMVDSKTGVLAFHSATCDFTQTLTPSDFNNHNYPTTQQNIVLRTNVFIAVMLSEHLNSTPLTVKFIDLLRTLTVNLSGDIDYSSLKVEFINEYVINNTRV